jgi:hypothetical protein
MMLRPTIGAANRENVAELPEIKLSSPDAYGKSLEPSGDP